MIQNVFRLHSSRFFSLGWNFNRRAPRSPQSAASSCLPGWPRCPSATHKKTPIIATSLTRSTAFYVLPVRVFVFCSENTSGLCAPRPYTQRALSPVFTHPINAHGKGSARALMLFITHCGTRPRIHRRKLIWFRFADLCVNSSWFEFFASRLYEL